MVLEIIYYEVFVDELDYIFLPERCSIQKIKICLKQSVCFILRTYIFNINQQQE